jgi:hypothetical protein
MRADAEAIDANATTIRHFPYYLLAYLLVRLGWLITVSRRKATDSGQDHSGIGGERGKPHRSPHGTECRACAGLRRAAARRAVVTELHRDPGARRPLPVVEHARWEGPFRILDSFPDVPVMTYRILEDPDTVPPPPSQVRGAVFMGGPMSVNDTTRFAGLEVETDWIRAALGPDFAPLLRAQAEHLEPARGQRAFDGFAALCARRSPTSEAGCR